MIKQSVKKPFTVLVAVIMVLVLGVVSVTSMTMDLLPPISLPYLIVITTYPGASAEKVEADVTVTMENSLGTITGVTNVYSTSSENYSMVQLEFEDGTDMDSVMVKVSSAVQQVSGSLPDLCGTPSIMELSMDMLAYAGVALFIVATLFQLVTLPVEFNASNRAVAALESSGQFTEEELKGVKKVLTAAALTYVAALLVSMMNLLRLILIVGGNGRRRR